MIKIVPLTNSKCGSGGQTYTAGDGIVISNGGISLASDALASVPQSLPSGGKIVQQGSAGGYISLGSAGSVTIGTDGGYRFSCGAGTASVKTQNNTGLFAADNSVAIRTNGVSRFIASGANIYIYGSTTAGAIRVYGSGSAGYVQVKSNNGNFGNIITESSYATSSAPGIVQPDNSTCFVQEGGILVAPGTIPAMTWHVADGGSTVSAPETSNAALTKVYINGMLVQPDEDYSLESGVITLSAPVSSGGKVVTEVYSGASVPVLDGGRSVNLTRSAAPENEEEPGEQPEEDPAEQEER